MILCRNICLLMVISILQCCNDFKTKNDMDYKINFYTQYHQFYICDKMSPGETDSQDFWTKAAHNDRLAMEEGIVGIGTECYGPVKAELLILGSVNSNVKYDSYDHIVEGGLELKSGVLQVVDCPNFNIECTIQLKPGIYRVRVYSSNLKSVNGDKGDDFYKIEIWPDTILERTVLKRYTGN